MVRLSLIRPRRIIFPFKHEMCTRTSSGGAGQLHKGRNRLLHVFFETTGFHCTFAERFANLFNSLLRSYTNEETAGANSIASPITFFLFLSGRC